MSDVKRCPRCGETRALAAFSKDRSRRDGYACWCKPCLSAWFKEHHRANPEKRRAAQREYYRSGAMKTQTPASPEVHRARVQKSSALHPDRRAARILVNNAIRDGRLTPQACERCGATDTHGHHEDYAKPMDVVWLCSPCHGKRHREINDERRQHRIAQEYEARAQAIAQEAGR